MNPTALPHPFGSLCVRAVASHVLRPSRIVLILFLTALALLSLRFASLRVYADGPTEWVSKSGVAGAIPNGATGTQTFNWTINYGLSSTAPSSVTLNDTWTAGQTLVSGSVHTPGEAWSYTQPISTSLTFSNALVAPNAQGNTVALSRPLSRPVSQGGSGDGFNPVLTASGKIFAFNHHINPANIFCYELNNKTGNATAGKGGFGAGISAPRLLIGS